MTDEELMSAVCQGDESAYQQLVMRYLKPISHYAYRLLHNSKDTEDIAQETFLKLWTQAGKWQPEKARLTTWLHRITHNLCVDHLRKHARLDLTSALEETADFDDLGMQSERDEQKVKLDKAILELPQQQREALALCHYQGFSNKDAADIMNLSVKALESALSRAKRGLRAALDLEQD